MNNALVNQALPRWCLTIFQQARKLNPFFAGLLIPLGFAPFHLPGIALLGIAWLFLLIDKTAHPYRTGFMFGVGFFGVGISWIYVSIGTYGHLNIFLSALITCLLVMYLALFPAAMTWAYSKLQRKHSLLSKCFLFSALWCGAEFLRSTLLGGFPWLLLAYAQMDTPLNNLLPILGVYGVGFLACFAATLLAASRFQSKRYPWICAFVGILLLPSLLEPLDWSSSDEPPLSVAVVQANLSMRDKWDNTLFWQLLSYYQHEIQTLMNKKNLIVLPESAIPVPANYVSDFLEQIDGEAKRSQSTVLLGIPHPVDSDHRIFYNSMMVLGEGQGNYLKQHLVPFGEFIPAPFQSLIDWLAVPVSNMARGKAGQTLIQVRNHAVASLICYELAYPALLRQQLPAAQWIVSISDDGWFGHSLAMYQQLQMAQVLSKLSARPQIVANNDGLSSIINSEGKILKSLPPFTAGVLEGELLPAKGFTPWMIYGDAPILAICGLIFILALLRTRRGGILTNPVKIY